MRSGRPGWRASGTRALDWIRSMPPAGAGCAVARPRCPVAARALAGAASACPASGEPLGLQLDANCPCLRGSPELGLWPPQVEEAFFGNIR